MKGPLAAYPVVGIKGILYDGSYHPVDSSEMAFKKAAMQAFKDGFLKAEPVLLEPIETLSVTVPDSYTGDVMGEQTERTRAWYAAHEGRLADDHGGYPDEQSVRLLYRAPFPDRRTGQLLLSVCAL